jgi:beta-N-acetylhexosaminidase
LKISQIKEENPMDKTLRHQIGQMIIAGFPSLEVDEQACRLVEEYQVGNFILFARNMQNARQTAAMCGALSRMAFDKLGVAPFIAADQ